MASIRQRGDTYQITVSLGRDPQGKKITETCTYKPQATTPKAIEKELRAYADEFERRVLEGKYLDGDKMTFTDFVDRWRVDWAERNVTQSTLESYTSILERRAYPSIGNMRLSKINALHIQRIMTDMEREGRAPKTVKRAMAAINSVFRYAYRMGVIQENPCARCELPRDKGSEGLHYFTLDQAKRFLASLSHSYVHTYRAHSRAVNDKVYTVTEYKARRAIQKQFKALFYLAIYGGFRRGELIGMQWRDIDFEKRTVSVVRAAAMTKSGQIIKDTKTKAGKRKIMLPKRVFDVLREWKADQMAHCMAIGTEWKGKRGPEYDENFVFIQMENGLMMHLSTPAHKFREIIDMYNEQCENEADRLPRIRLHDLRHTSATLLLAEGVDIETVSNRLGHTRASVTLDVYGHALETMDEKASECLDRMFAAGV